MFFARKRVCTAVLAVLLTVSGAVSAAVGSPEGPAASGKDVQKAAARKSLYTPEERAAEEQRRIGIVERANTVFTLVGGETALQKGDAGTALATYMVMLDRTKNPEVAERALEMAVSLNAFEQAEMIYQKWRAIEPVPGAAQKRMIWVRSLLMGNTEQTLKDFDEVLAGAQEPQVKRLFLLMAQTAVRRPSISAAMTKEVHRAAGKYPDMPEAAIADAIFSAQGGKERQAVEALRRLAQLDTEILPPTELTLRLIAHRNPAVLSRFFAQADTKNLSSVWQELEIGSLVAEKQYDKAYARLQELLSQKPDAGLYMQAAMLSTMRKDNIAVFESYIEKAYRTGNSDQKSRAALMAAMRHADAGSFAKASSWLAKITASSYAFDKAVLSASVFAEQGRGSAALAEARKAQRLPEQQGRYFNAADLQRVYISALAKHNKPQAALAELNTLAAQAERQPDRAEKLPDILYQRAMIYADRLHRYDRAIADLRRYLELNPNSAAGMNALGYTMLTADKKYLDEAFGLIQTAYSLEPESAAINDSMGWAYYQKGDARAALPYLQYAFGNYPDAEVAAHLGEVLWQLGDKAQAESVWRKGLSRQGNVEVLRKTMQRFGVAPAGKPQPGAKSKSKPKTKAK